MPNLVFLATIVFGWHLVYKDCENNGEPYRKMYFGVRMLLIIIIIFTRFETYVPEGRSSGGMKCFLPTERGHVFGACPLKGFIRGGGCMDVIYQKCMPYIGCLPAFLGEIFGMFWIRAALIPRLKMLQVFCRVL